MSKQQLKLSSSKTIEDARGRGAYDFETWEWVNPRGVGLKWGTPENRDEVFFGDPESKYPKVVAAQALQHMNLLAKEVGQWWGHNAGKFDALFILEACASLGWKAKCHVAGGRVISLTVFAPNGIFKLHDSFAIISTSLKKAAEGFQLKDAKLFTKDDYSKDIRTWDMGHLRTGCLIDCELVLQLLEKIEPLFQEEGGQLKTTAASSAFSVVAAKTEILDMRKLVGVNRICRMAYSGGRVEVYRHTPQYPISVWDVNSSYPHSMTQELPWRYIGQVIGKNAAREFERVDRCGVVEATVIVSPTYLPVLPWRHPQYSGVYFPVGVWRGQFDSAEMLYALEHGVRIKTLHAMQSFSKESPFEGFIHAFYALKSKTIAGPAREFYKLILNTAYGKFGQKPEKEELVIYPTQDEAIDAAFKHAPNFRFVSKDYRYGAITSEVWSKQTHYALASAITARSRVTLHSFLSSADKIAYTDTDSIHSSANTSIGLYESESAKLGYLKRELSDYSAVYAAPKIYGLTANTITPHPKTREPHYDEKFASKGFPVDKETFLRLLKGETIETHRIQLAKRQLAGDNTVRRDLQGRSWKGLSTKRCPLYDANGDTRPWTVDELMSDAHLKAISPLAKWLSKR